MILRYVRDLLIDNHILLQSIQILRLTMSKKKENQQSNKPSNLLSAEENQQVCTLLGPKCRTIATAVVQLYYTKPPSHSQWFKRDVGIICFVKDNKRKNYFFRMYCLRRNGLIWEQEAYSGMEYNTDCPFLHSFEGDNCIYAFNFACLNEAKEVKQVIGEKLTVRRLIAAEKATLTRNERVKQRIVNETIKNTDRKKNHKRRLTKADIGIPTGFRHIGKVSWDADKGLGTTGTADDLYQEIFRKAGVNQKMLENRSTREFVYDFVDNYSTIKNIAEQTQSPKSITVAPTRTAPRPPKRTAPPPPPRDNKSSSKPIQHKNDQSSLPPNYPPPPLPSHYPPSVVPTTKISLGNPPFAPPPPPPPPPPPVELNVPPVNTEPSLTTNKTTDVRSALLESIRQGATLKRVPDESSLSEPSRDHVLKQIKGGVSLKSAADRELKSPAPVDEVNDIAMALKKVLESRSSALRCDDESTSSTSSDDEWDP